MSDGVQIALITGMFGLVTVVLTHILSKRDRALARETVDTKNEESETLRTQLRWVEADRDWWKAQAMALRDENVALIAEHESP